jgi:quercetin dioxygenase-like cupin family protein
MTPHRSPDLAQLLNSAEATLRHAGAADARMRAATERMFTALQTPATQVDRPQAARLPVCHYLAPALQHAQRQPGPVGDLADAFAAIEPRLAWQVRAGAEAYGERFLAGHANATIAGPDGIEIRGDVRIGVSLMAPHTRYPDHRHPPEEIYVVLSEGQWRQANDPWHEPGMGGLVYNPPNIVHAMRSAARPLLALWFLWTEPDAPAAPV